jgi:hypothetical protein
MYDDFMKEPKLQFSVRQSKRKFKICRVPNRPDWHIIFTPPKEARMQGAPGHRAAGPGTNLIPIAKERAGNY